MSLTAYVRYDNTGRIVPGGPIVTSVKPKVGDWVAVDDVLTTVPNYKLRGFIRCLKNGKYVAGSLVLQRSVPKDGNWKEIYTLNPACCATTTSTTTQAPVECGTFVEGNEAYPNTTPVIIGSGTGIVDFHFNAYSTPDRFIIEWNNDIVADTGYKSDYPEDWTYGGEVRSFFTDSLIGKVDPVSGNTYPDFTNYPDDGYPLVYGTGQGSTLFNKSLSSPSDAKVVVYAPTPGTIWDYTLDCFTTTTTTTAIPPPVIYYYNVTGYSCGTPCADVGPFTAQSTTPLTIGYFYNNPENRGYSFEILEERVPTLGGYDLTGEPGYATCTDACNPPFIGINASVTVNSATASLGGWNASAYSSSTYNVPVTVTWNLSSTNASLMGGFSFTPTASLSTYQNAAYGFYCEGGNLKIYENGSNVNTISTGGTITSSSVFKVVYDGVDVKYYLNNVLQYTSLQAVTGPLYIFFPILDNNQGPINITVI